MRHICTLATILFLYGTGTAQSINSVVNGPFYFPTTWDCMCIPMPQNGQDITIGHSVTANGDIAVIGGSIWIGENGTLVEDATPRSMLVQQNGAIHVEGMLVLSQLYVQSGQLHITTVGNVQVPVFANGDVSQNSGQMFVADSMWNNGLYSNMPGAMLQVSTFLNSDILNNSGEILGVDSMTNAGYMFNDEDGVLQADSALNLGLLENSGQMTLVALLNEGTFENDGQLMLNDLLTTSSFTNRGVLQATGSMTNLGTFTNDGQGSVELEGSLLNASQIPPIPFGPATLTNDGGMTIGANMYNFAIITGTAPGTITVQDTTYSHGQILGTVDICDETPTTEEPPILDFNFGIVDFGVTFCGIPMHLGERDRPTFSIAPNPASEMIRLDGADITGTIIVTDAEGRIVLQHAVQHAASPMVDISALRPGLYVVHPGNGSLPVKLVVQR